MNLHLNLTNCYGIPKLEKEIDFISHNVGIIYAPNGTMKSSLAKTFMTLADGGEVEDRVFEERKTIADITIGGEKIEKNNVLVMNPIKEEKCQGTEIMKLVLDDKLKTDFDNHYEELRSELHKLIKVVSGRLNITASKLESELKHYMRKKL